MPCPSYTKNPKGCRRGGRVQNWQQWPSSNPEGANATCQVDTPPRGVWVKGFPSNPKFNTDFVD